MKKVFVQLESGRGYGRDLLKGIYEYNNRFSEWEIIFEPAYYLKTTENRDIVKMIELMKPDGCILENIENTSEITRLDIPIIQADWAGHVGKFPCIKGNYEADGKVAADYFLNIGFKNLAFFGVKNLDWSDVRFLSFKKHAEQGGSHVFNYMAKIRRKKGLSYNLNRIISWLKSLPKPIGILCCNDDFGQILINACSMGDLKVPHEIAVLGIDNDELLCNITYPHLSSIARNHRRAAINACDLLSRMMNAEAVEDMLIPTEPTNVVVRNSTDTIACNNVEIVKALHHIRSNAHLPITVSDVVKSTHLSRRSLYTKFKEVTGNTIKQEIHSQKLKKFKELLENQSLSVKEIAFRLGFNDVSHVSRWFSSIEGISPLQWRKINF